MKSTRPLLALLLAGLSLFAFGARAQTSSELETLYGPVDAAELPVFATYWFIQEQQPPLPFDPFHGQLPVYMIGTSGTHFLVDDRSVDYVALREEQQARRALRTLLSQSDGMQLDTVVPPPPGDGWGEGEDPGVPAVPAYSYATGSLWLEMLAVTNNYAVVALHGTIQDELYDIFSKVSLTDTVWVAEGEPFLGAADQTVVWLPLDDRTNSLFLKARSFVSSDGSGMPDWWQLQYFESTGVDPYADADQDGWTNLQEYQNGTTPTTFDTPPPPNNTRATINPDGSEVLITWEQGSAPAPLLYRVWSYGSGYWSETAQVPGNVFSLVDQPLALFYKLEYPVYCIRADYAGGRQADSAPFAPYSLVSDVSFWRGGPDQFLVTSFPGPEQLLGIEFYRILDGSTNWIGMASFTNGVAPWPTAETGLHFSMVRSLDGSGDQRPVGVAYKAEEWLYYSDPFVTRGENGFLDTRRHMKENLMFLLRAAGTTAGFTCFGGNSPSNSPPESSYTRLSLSTDYEYYGFHTYSPNLGYAFVAESRALRDNFHWADFIPGSARSLNWFPDCAALNFLKSQSSFHHEYEGNGLESPLPYMLTNSLAPLLYGYSMPSELECESDAAAEWGVNLSATTVTFPQGMRNVWGLPLLQACYNSQVLLPGQSTPYRPYSEIFVGTALPQLRTVGYYFGSQTAHFRYGAGPMPLPGSPDFSNNIPNLPIITGFGQPLTVSGWAKQAIDNGYPGKYAYLEQFFEKVYVPRSSGLVAVEPAVLSRYGEFLPTVCGTNLLVTMPDLDTDERGTGVVHVVKLQTDVNHDGVMDLSFGGPDNTSKERSQVMWVNNDCDRGHTVDITDYEEDDLSSTDSHADCPWNKGHPTPDCEYRDASGNRVIPSERDLEDFARLWVCGITTNLLARLPPGTTISLSWGDLGNPNSSNPTIDLFQAFESAGGIGYLTNLTTARLQTNASICQYVGRLGPGSNLVLNASRFLNNWAGEHLIWCGVSNGTGALTLTISQGGTNTLAQTTAYIQLQDIKLMYERWSVGDNGTKDPTNTAYIAQENMPAGVPFFQYGASTDPNTPYILHVHGWNMDLWEKDRFGETMFKRLYWQGYQGRFGIFRWPTLSGFPSLTGQGADLNHFDESEQQAWKSGVGLRNLLVALNAKYPGQVRLTAHSMGNIVAGEALRTNTALAAIYVAMQGAVPAGAYDMAAPFRAIPTSYFDGTTELYRFYPVGTPSRPYFYQVAGAGVYVDFYNPLDWALNLWQTDQNLKPDDTLGYSFDISTGTFYQYQGKSTQRVLTCPTNTYELFAYNVEGQCWALGAQINVGGVFDKTQQLDLNAAFSFGSAHKGHSGQFRSTYMDREPFWNALGNRLGVLP